jgi:hypothetical protein
MEHSLDFTNQMNSRRYGFHYFPDSLHYRSDDLETWIPELKALGASWLVLQSEANRAIPEEFILGLVKEKIEPIIHFPLNLADPISTDKIDPILSAYAKWGVHYVIFFDRPNSRTAWGDLSWGQNNLVDRFIDQFLPLAQSAVEYGLTPVFPPLEPGGHYWDTVFLRHSLERLQARNAVKILEKIAIAAYAWTWEKPLNWGFGGQEQWPLSRPYRIPSGSQDERGFRIFDWYHSITRTVLQRTCPIILLQTGISFDPASIKENSETVVTDNKNILDILKLLNNENVYDAIEQEQALKPLPEEVLCCNFWLLSSGKSDINANQSWIMEDGEKSAIAQDVINYFKSSNSIELYSDKSIENENPFERSFSISRYLFFPSLEWFLQNGQKEEIQEYIKRYKPTIGFSIKEAAYAEVVTIAGVSESIPDAEIEVLRASGCFVNQLSDPQENVINIYTGEKLGDYPTEKTLEYASV